MFEIKKVLFRGFIISSLFSIISACLPYAVSVDAATYVKSYFRKDGTFVGAHFRSNPDHSFLNNYSTYGNINPFTGEKGTKLSPSQSYKGFWNEHYLRTIENEYPYTFEEMTSNNQVVEEKLSKKEFKANNSEFYDFKSATEEAYKEFLYSSERTIKNESVHSDLATILEKFKNEVEVHKVDGQYEFAREGLVDEIALMQSHLQSKKIDFEELALQIESIKLNYQDVVSVLDRLDK